MMVLIVVASRHGATGDIADALAVELRRHDFVVDVWGARDMPAVQGYDAVILGSAVYMGNWLPDARRFWEAERAALTTVPLWLFSSGPLGDDDPKPHGDPDGITDIREASDARGHRVFVGKLDRKNLGFAERLAAKVVHAPEGDFRDWDDIREWARDIAAALPAAVATG
ncbi:MAG: flavodoxin domain-containing protein [Dehalococcoidia bacterium]